MLSPCSAHALFNYNDGRAVHKHGLQPEPGVSAVRTTASIAPCCNCLSPPSKAFGGALN